MSLDLNRCSGDCLSCIRAYKKKHALEAGQKFEIECVGIVNNEILDEMLQDLSAPEQRTAKGVLDPVAWAEQNLDWHCLDPDGEKWKRKNPAEYDKWMRDNPDTDIYGKSRYHRPYQALMLRCSAQYKVFRIGRQAGKTEAIVVSMLYHLVTKPHIPENEGYKIIVITPYQSQIDLIFNRMNQLIRQSPILRNSVSRSVKAPNYQIELYNGSTVKGFTAGTRSGGNAESVRGQAANMLVFDEADYLSPSDMDSALAIVTNYPLASVWMSSTPSGKREKFYETCYLPDWKEFYFSSRINPMWSERLNSFFKRQLTATGYKHEVLAEFGEQEEGVFQNMYVQACKADYEYGDHSFHKDWVYTMGVDWNDVKNGTTIAIVGFDPARNKFFVVNTETVSREGWTQLTACDKIAELNRIWRPKSIYLDAGYGATQWEVLRKFSFDSSIDPTKGPLHPDSRLKDILTKYDFSSKVETRDLWTKKIIQKDAKPFLVESTVRRFETDEIRFPASDKLLEKQLLGYIIDRITVTGRPVYKANDEQAGDHILDAIMLAIVAFTLEVTSFGKPLYTSQIAFTGRIGENNEPDIYEGDVILKRDARRDAVDERDRHKPSMDRLSGVKDETSIIQTPGLPANHTKVGRKTELWSWPGFNRDAPRPRVRSLSEAENDARRRLGIRPRNVGKPRRKNI